MLNEADYTGITSNAAYRQWASVAHREPAAPGKRQVAFVPVETLMCLAAMYAVDHTRFGSSSARRAPEPVQSLARLFRRPPTSIIAKMANLDGSRSHGAKHDLVAGVTLRSDVERMARVYRTVLQAARLADIGSDRLPDFLGLEDGHDLVMLGQEELTVDEVGSVVEQQMRRHLDEELGEVVTQRMLVASIRVGQHRFASDVLHNCGRACVFCGFTLGDKGSPSLLRASHIKPWRSATSRERLDLTNGLAACPTHDAAFDVGLLTVGADLSVVRSRRLNAAIARNDVTANYFGDGHLHSKIALPGAAARPDLHYVQWHNNEIFVDA